MRRLTTWGATVPALALGLLVSPSPAAGSPPPGAGTDPTIWVTDRSGDRLAVYDARSGSLLATPGTEHTDDPARADEPNDVAIAQGKAYATNEGTGTISVFDVRTRRLVTRLEDAGPKPHHAVTNPRGDLVAYGVYGTNEVKHGDQQVQGTVAAVDVRTGSIGCELDVGLRPSEALPARGGRIGYVSVRNENAIKEIDLRRCRLTGRSVDLGEQVDTLWLTGDERTMSVGLRGPAPAGQRASARVATVDVRTFRPRHVRFWAIPGGTLTGHQYTTPDGRYTYAAFEGPDAGLAVIDHARDTVRTLPPMGGRPHGVAVTGTIGDS